MYRIKSRTPAGLRTQLGARPEYEICCSPARSTAASSHVVPKKLDGQRAGHLFERAVQEFLETTFPALGTIRPGNWRIENVGGSRAEYHVARYEPYTHLDDLAIAIRQNPMLASVLGNSYEISPDVLVLREPEPDEVINRSSSPSVVPYNPTWTP